MKNIPAGDERIVCCLVGVVSILPTIHITLWVELGTGPIQQHSSLHSQRSFFRNPTAITGTLRGGHPLRKKRDGGIQFVDDKLKTLGCFASGSIQFLTFPILRYGDDRHTSI